MTLRFKEQARPLNETDLKAVESELGYALPKPLRDHYSKVNGGVPSQKKVFGANDLETSVHTFLPIADEQIVNEPPFGELRMPTLEGTVARVVKAKKQMPVTLLPFATNAGGDYFCVDRKSGAVCIYFMEDCKEPKKAARKLFDSFDEFLAALGNGGSLPKKTPKKK